VTMQIPAWNKSLMASGAYYRANLTSKLMQKRSLEDIVADFELLYYAEGLDGTVSVKSKDGDRFLAVNGKTDASSRGDLPTQILLGQLPLQLDRQVSKVMVIGLGSGITVGTVAANPSIESLTVLEISPEVVEASAFFEPENNKVLDDPRVELVTADARNFLLATQDRYDVIISEPSNPWISGISNLFTSEFFSLARSRLNPGGVMTQWFHSYSMSGADFRTVLRTFSDQFAHVTVWRSLPGDLVLMGSDQPHALVLGRARWSDVSDHNAAQLKRAGVVSDRDLVRHYIIGGDPLKRFVLGARGNSDKHPLVEFNAPRNLYASTSKANMSAMVTYLGGRNFEVPVKGLFRLKPDTIEVESMGLNITAREVEQPNAKWLLAWYLKNDTPKQPFAEVSARVLTWVEHDAQYFIQTSSHKEEIPPAKIKEQMVSLLGVKEADWGDVVFADGTKGLSALVPDVQNQRIQLAIGWNCASETDGFNQFAFVASLADPGLANWNEAVSNQAGRFSCL